MYPVTDAPYWPSIMRGTRVPVKPDILKNSNKYFYSPYSNETFYMEALDKKDFKGVFCFKGE